MPNPPKSRGRQPIDYIYRFNIATDLCDSKRFGRFKRELQISINEAFTLVVRLWNFTAKNRGVTGRIDLSRAELSPLIDTINRDNSDIAPNDDTDDVADFCWWHDDPVKLMRAFLKSGIIEPDGMIHNWLENQPYADKKHRQRKTEKGIIDNNRDYKGNNRRIIDNSSRPEDRSPNTVVNDVKKHRSIDASMVPKTRLQPDDVAFWPTVNAFLDRIQEPHIHGILSDNDTKGLKDEFTKHGVPLPTVLDWMITQLIKDTAEKKAGESGLKSQIGWLRTNIRKQS